MSDFQGWLYKRSRVTKVYQKRYVLIRGSRVYSFRKLADVLPPDPATATLTWDVAGAQVSPKKKVENTFVVYGGALKGNEQVVFTAKSREATNDWMAAFLRAARGPLVTASPVGTLQIEVLKSDPSLGVLVAEYENNRIFATSQLTFPIRADRPHDVLTLELVKDGLETPVAQIPRFKIPRVSGEEGRGIQVEQGKPGSPLSAASKRLVEESREFLESTLTSDISGVFVFMHGSVVVKVWTKFNNTLEKTPLPKSMVSHVKWLMQPVSGQQSQGNFELEHFKTQIRRASRLADIFKEFRASLADIVEWRNFRTSIFWLMYICTLLFLFPGWTLSAFVVHATIAMHKNGQRATADANADSLATFSSMSPTTTFAPEGAQSPHVQQRSPVNGGGEGSQAAGLGEPGTGEGEFPGEIWENQRRLIGTMSFHANNLLVLDRPRFSDEGGSSSLAAPDPKNYSVEISDKTDENGWTYSFRWRGTWSRSCGTLHFVRRRKWKLNLTYSRPTTPQGGVGEGGHQTGDVTPRTAVQDGNGNNLDAEVDEEEDEADFSGSKDDETGVSGEASGGGLALFPGFRRTLTVAQQEIEEGCDDLERVIGLFAWDDIAVSRLVFYFLGFFSVVSFFVPINVLLGIYTLSLFLSGWKKGRWKKVLRAALVKQMRASANDDLSRFAQNLSRRAGVEVSVRTLQGRAEGDVAEELRKKILPWPIKWTRRDFSDNLIEHVPTYDRTDGRLKH